MEELSFSPNDSGYRLVTSELTPLEEQHEKQVNLLSSLMGYFKTLFLGVAESIGSVFGPSALMWTSLASSLAGFISGLLVIKQVSGGWTQSAVFVQLVTSAITAINAISVIVQQLGKTFETQLAIQVAQEGCTALMSSSDDVGEVQSNASGMKYIQMAVAILSVSLLAGVGITGLKSWSDINTISHLTEGFKKTYTNMSGLTDWFLSEVLQIHDERDILAIRELEKIISRVAELLTYPVSRFIVEESLFSELQNMYQRSLEVTSMPMNKDVSQRYQSARVMLQQLISQVMDKLKGVHAIRETVNRQCTQAYVLSGSPGIGKSTLINFINQKVCERLSIPYSQYCLNRKKDGFWEPYGAQPAGVYNEWMSTRQDDPLLPDFNLIVSEDPMNFEAAHLEGKVQPCRLKILGLTTNDPNPPLARTLHEVSAQAIWDRLIHIQVEDKCFKGRAFKNTHQKSDFSHLDLILKVHSQRSDKVMAYPITLAELISLLTGKVARAEHTYLRNLTSNGVPEIDLDVRLQYLDEILLSNSPFIDTFTKRNQIARSNNNTEFTSQKYGRSFFVWRFQGPIGSGKTTVCQRLAEFIGDQYGLPVHHYYDLQDWNPTRDTPECVILDDCVESDTYLDYIRKVNTSHYNPAIYLQESLVSSFQK